MGWKTVVVFWVVGFDTGVCFCGLVRFFLPGVRGRDMRKCFWFIYVSSLFFDTLPCRCLGVYLFIFTLCSFFVSFSDLFLDIPVLMLLSGSGFFGRGVICLDLAGVFSSRLFFSPFIFYGQMYNGLAAFGGGEFFAEGYVYFLEDIFIGGFFFFQGRCGNLTS